MKDILARLSPSFPDLANIPQRYRSIAIDPFSKDGVVSAGLRAMHEKKSVLLHGAVGRGKSFIACYWACHFAAMHHAMPYFAVVPELYAKGQLQEFREKHANTALLVLDDVSRGDSWGKKDALFEIVNSRYNDCLPTIATTTLSLREFEKRDSAMLSRISSDGVILKLNGNDRRKR